MIKRYAALILTAALILAAPSPIHSSEPAKAHLTANPQAKPDPYKELLNQYIMAYVWFQTSGEARALYYQAFKLADMMLESNLADPSVTKKRAVIVDIDETILDNSPYNVALTEEDREFDPTLWDQWVKLAKARALPGAVEFLTKADRLGVDIYYVSNRSQDELESTIRNLKAAGFPQADASHLLLSRGEHSKESRRQLIEQDHHIVLLMGDNLNDFANVFEGKNVADRNKEVDRLRNEFGKSFIVLPNPMYGDWEAALYNYKRLTPEQKLAARKQALSSYPLENNP